MSRTTMLVRAETWSRAAPLRITGYVHKKLETIFVRLQSEGHEGCGEAAGIYYRNETPQLLIAQIEAVRPAIETGIDRDTLQQLLPAGGARNAVDCALWDLQAKASGRPAWELAGLNPPKPLLTVFTCSAEEPVKMAAAARAFGAARALKLKLTGEQLDADRVRAVRDARPDAWLCVDANQGFTRRSLEQIMPLLVDSAVRLIEQPFPLNQDSLLDDFQSPIPIAADESLQDLSDVPSLVGRFSVGNIKLDKSGGLTRGLAIAHLLRSHGLGVMVGNMGGTSLGMAPGFLLGQLATVVDLDGAALLACDRTDAVRYQHGHILEPQTLWGHPRSHIDSPALS